MDLTGSTLIVVADSRRAGLFGERRRGGGLTDLTPRLGTLDPRDPRPLPARAPRGDVHDRFGPASHTGDRPTPKERREDDFVRQVGARAADIMRRDGYRDLVLVAAPRALGRLRKAMEHAGVAVTLAEASDRTSESLDSIRYNPRALEIPGTHARRRRSPRGRRWRRCG